MAYDKEKLYEEAKHFLDLPINNDVVNMYEVMDELGISSETFYRHFPVDSKESKYFKKVLRQNASRIKRELRKEFKNGATAERLALYKLLGNEDELRALNGQYVDHTSKGEKINITPIQFNDNAKEIDD